MADWVGEIVTRTTADTLGQVKPSLTFITGLDSDGPVFGAAWRGAWFGPSPGSSFTSVPASHSESCAVTSPENGRPFGNRAMPLSSGAMNTSFDCPNMVVNAMRSPGLAMIMNSYDLPGSAGPGFSSPFGVLKIPAESTPSWCMQWLASMVGSPSSAWDSSPQPRCTLPASNSRPGIACTTHAPGELGAGAVVPLESWSVEGVDTFSMR